MQKILILLLFPIFLQAQKSKDTFTPEQIREDMSFLKKRFEKIHPGMYYYISKDAYNLVFDSLNNSINKPLNYLETF